MFGKKAEKKRVAAIKVKALGMKDIDAALERIQKEFPVEEAESPIQAVAYRFMHAGACAMADEIIHGERGEKDYEEMREDVTRIADSTAIANIVGIEGKGAPAELGEILKEVLG